MPSLNTHSTHEILSIAQVLTELRGLLSAVKISSREKEGTEKHKNTM